VEVIMTSRLIVILGAVVIGAACDSKPRLTLPMPTSPTVSLTPTPTPPPTATPPPGPPIQERGPIPTSATVIAAGEIAGGAVQSTDPVCFPNWDLMGRCRQYELTAAIDGTLVAILTWPDPARGIYSPELFFVAPTSRGSGPTKSSRTDVEALVSQKVRRIDWSSWLMDLFPIDTN
jgi:hypothetical protein